MKVKVDGSSVEFDRGILGLTALGMDAETLAEVVARASALRSELR